MAEHRIVALNNAEAVRITPAGLHGGMDITLQNNETEAYVFVGAEGVTPTNFGYRILPGGHAISFELPSSDSLYAVTDVASANVSVMQIGLESQN